MCLASNSVWPIGNLIHKEFSLAIVIVIIMKSSSDGDNNYSLSDNSRPRNYATLLLPGRKLTTCYVSEEEELASYYVATSYCN
jgi:hypothetical protein